MRRPKLNPTRDEPTGYVIKPGGPNGHGDWTAWMVMDGDRLFFPIVTGKNREKVERQAEKYVRRQHADWAWRNSGKDEQIVNLFPSNDKEN